MNRGERRRLLLELKTDPQGFGERANEAIFKGDGKFLVKVTELMKSIEIDSQTGFMKSIASEFRLFHERVAAAYVKLFLKHGPFGVTAPMIYKAVDPKIAPKHYSRAFRRLGLPRFSKRPGSTK